ncbi:MAG: MinD/ParA family protein [Deltaproteobacteria bacterium]|nr:MinD/ParA family protein [Deltaproteobacteria bacterium]
MTSTMPLKEAKQAFRKAPVSHSWQRTPPRVIAVTSGKGGVGKSNIVANLGVAMSQSGYRVMLIDADLGLANLDILLGLTPQHTIKDFFSLRQSLSQVIMQGPAGLKVLPAYSGLPELTELGDSQKVFLLNELDYYSENLDVVLIDTGAGISRNVLFFNVAAQERILVANNQPTSLADVYALMKVLVMQHKQTRFKLVVNGIRQPHEGEAVYRTLVRVAERFLGQEIFLEYLGFIPFDVTVSEAVMRQQPVISLYPAAPASKSFARIARQLLESPAPSGVDGNIKFFWRQLLGC